MVHEAEIKELGGLCSFLGMEGLSTRCSGQLQACPPAVACDPVLHLQSQQRQVQSCSRLITDLTSIPKGLPVHAGPSRVIQSRRKRSPGEAEPRVFGTARCTMGEVGRSNLSPKSKWKTNTGLRTYFLNLVLIHPNTCERRSCKVAGYVYRHLKPREIHKYGFVWFNV